MASKKLRFDVFKRDSFTCQYCGRTPPAVVLEVDHVIPKSKGGPNRIENYITACFECNRGKGKHSLETAPTAVADNLVLLKEKRLQLKEYNRLIEKQEAEENAAIMAVNEVFSDNFPGLSPTDGFSQVTMRRFLSQLPLVRVKQAMSLACSTRDDDAEAALRYFCGICWNWIKQPETRNW